MEDVCDTHIYLTVWRMSVILISTSQYVVLLFNIWMFRFS